MLVFGLIEADGDVLYNTAVVVDAGRLVGTHRKINLLSGERSTFAPGLQPGIFEVDGLAFGVNVCSDTQDSALALAVASAGAKLIVCPANNMMRRQKADLWKDRHNETRACRAREAGVWFMSSDVTGTRGDSIGLGPTCIIDPQGKVVAQVPLMEVGIVVAEIELAAAGGHNHTLQWTGTASHVLVD
jgi:predicted amidohydrolase